MVDDGYIILMIVTKEQRWFDGGQNLLDGSTVCVPRSMEGFAG